MTRVIVLVLVLLALCQGPAAAALAPADLDAVGLAPTPGQVLPLATPLTDQHGTTRRLGDALGHRPTVLVLADYDCRAICGPILAVLAGALAGTGLTAGRDYDLVAVGLNPRATPADAARMGAAQLGPLAADAHLLSGAPDAVAAIERALGYRAVFDPRSGRYAHPADILVLTPDARVSRLLPGLALDPATMRLALVQAGQGRIGTLGDRLHLLCYGLDPASGVANRAVGIVLTAGATLTLAGLALFVVALARRPAPSFRGGAGQGPRPSQRAGVTSRGGEAEPGSGVLWPSKPRLPGSGSSLRSVRNEGAKSSRGFPASPP